MTTGHLTISFDLKRPSATFVWPDTGEAIKVTYVDTVDLVMQLATSDQRRIMLPLGQVVEPIPGVRMNFYEQNRRRVRIEARRASESFTNRMTSQRGPIDYSNPLIPHPHVVRRPLTVR